MPISPERRRGSVAFDFGSAPVRNPPAREIIGEHRCETCGERASFGYGVRLLKGIEGRWRCFAHRIPDEALPQMGAV